MSIYTKSSLLFLLFALAGEFSSSANASSYAVEKRLPTTISTGSPSTVSNHTVDDCEATNTDNCEASEAMMMTCTPVSGQINIEGSVFEDSNNNGTLDVGESGSSQVAVEVYKDNNSDGVLDGADLKLATVVTDGNGDYSYTFPPAIGSVADDFSSGNFNAGTNWTSPSWITSGAPEVSAGEARLEDDENIFRSLNLSTASTATISLSYREVSTLEANDRLIIEICSDATFGNCQTLVDISDDIPTGAGVISNVAIDADKLTATTTLRLGLINYQAGGLLENPEYAYFDNVLIDYTTHQAGDYVLSVNTSTLDSDFNLTTDNVEIAVYSANGQKDCDNNFGYNLLDSDGDTKPDRDDLDDDNDGILDVDECVTPITSVLDLTTKTFTDSGQAGDVGDKSLYSSAGTFNGAVFDLELVVISNPSPSDLAISLNEAVTPILLTGANVGAYPELQMNFYRTGTSIPFSMPLDITWRDIDTPDAADREAVRFNTADVELYQVSSTTDIIPSVVTGKLIGQGAGADTNEDDEDAWFRTKFLASSTINFELRKRAGTPGYFFNVLPFTNGATEIILNVPSFKCYTDTDNDGIVNSLDLDSDGDGCSDANEYYGSPTADGGDAGTYGTDPVTVSTSGQVTGAVYSGNYAIALDGICTIIDSDRDLVLDGDDLDNDNDGISDVEECSDNAVAATTFEPILTVNDTTFTSGGITGDVGDKMRYGNVGSLNGTTIDLVLTVVSNSDPSTMTVNIEGVESGGILYPVFLDGATTAESTTIRFEYFETGTNTPVTLNSELTWKDIDFEGSANNTERISFLTSDLISFTTETPTDIESNNETSADRTDFITDASGNNTDLNLMVRTLFQSRSSIEMVFTKRAASITGYVFGPVTFSSPLSNPINCPDLDNDGIPNSFDLDSDNDGCPDFAEGGGTFIPSQGRTARGTLIDGNGNAVTTNLGTAVGSTSGVDLGVPTMASAGQTIGQSNNSLNSLACDIDTDNDGVTDSVDIDTDNDGIPDDVEILTATNGGDSDNDGIADHYDLDSDNDGIPDLIEAGGTDSNGDGVVDDACIVPAVCDTDGDGLMDSSDADNAGPVTGIAGTLLPVNDTDGDGHPDFQDLDADNDAINDITEAGITDTDNNGIVDQVNLEGTLSADTDGDGFSDSLDSNDNTVVGTNDGVGTAGITTDPDANSDGQPDDDDNDGTAYNADDNDSDGVPNFRDLDSDNDGIGDVIEGGNKASDTNSDGVLNIGDTGYADADQDGIPDPIDNSPNSYGDAGNTAPTDTDNDGTPDYQDLDSDNDSINDVIEAGNSDIDGDGQVANPTVDTDGDGIADSVDGAPATFGDEVGTGDDPTDTDTDGIPDSQELDSDGDSTTDFEAAGGDLALDANGDGAVDDDTDTDGDGIADVVDGSASGFGDMFVCGAGALTYAMSDGTINTTGYQWNGTADVVSTDQFGLTRATAFCESNNWRHYYNVNQPDKLLFSIEMGSNTTEIEYVEIRVLEVPLDYYDTSATNALFPMSRDWHVKTVNNTALTAPVNARFYYVPSELETMLDNAVAYCNTDPNATPPTASDIVWFKKSTYDPSTDINPDGSALTNGAGFTQLTANVVAGANGESETDQGVNYVQFNGLTGFSGGGSYVMTSSAPLPVTLASFTGEANGCDVQLNWTSASEQDFSHYEVEWSSDGTRFSEIANLVGVGNSTTMQNYSYTHASAESQNYYRLKQVDFDGFTEYSKTIVVNTDCSSASMRAFPNPVSKSSSGLTLTYEGTTDVVEFYISDMYGRIVEQRDYDVSPQVSNTLNVDVSNLPTGTYFIGVTDPLVRVPVTKFIVTN